MAGVVILDYGSGNLASAERALKRTGADVQVTDDFELALEADGSGGAGGRCLCGLHGRLEVGAG